MRTFFFLTFLFASCFVTVHPAVAQSYIPLLDSLNEWHYTGNYFPVRQQTGTNCSYPLDMYQDFQYTGGDTVLLSENYKVLYRSSGCICGYLREDTAARKVFFLPNDLFGEFVLYDFSLQVNDVFPVTFFTGNGYWDSGLYQLDSIGQIILYGRAHRIFNFHHAASTNTHVLSWVEGVGNRMNVIYTHGPNCYGMGWFSTCMDEVHENTCEFMTCFVHAYPVYYDSCALREAMTNNCILFVDSCDYGNICGAVGENILRDAVTLLSDPAHGSLRILLDRTFREGVALEFRDLQGRQLAAFSNLQQEATLAVGEVPPGVYLLEVRAEGKVAAFKVLLPR